MARDGARDALARMMDASSVDLQSEHPGHDRVWPETSCYVDAWIALLTARGLVAEAGLGFALELDWEADQFTFLKIPLHSLETLYGIDVREIFIQRSLGAHAAAHLGQGRVVLAEVDAFHLPDTVATTYRHAHQKTTIGLVGIDPVRREARYVHNATWATLSGLDYDAILDRDPGGLAFYTDTVRFGDPLEPDALRPNAAALLLRHLRRCPGSDAVWAWADGYGRGLRMVADGAMRFHDHAFGTTRQLGSGFELLAIHLAWLDPALDLLAGHARAIAAIARSIQFRSARAVARSTHPELKQPFEAIDIHRREVIEGLRAYLA